MRVNATLCLLTTLMAGGCGRPADTSFAPPPARPKRTTPPLPAPTAGHNVAYSNIPLPADELDGLGLTKRALQEAPGGVVAVATVDNHTRYDLSAITLTLTLDFQDAQGRALPTAALPVEMTLPPQTPGDTVPLKSASEKKMLCRPVRPDLPPGARITGYFMTVASAEGFPLMIDQTQPLSDQILQAAEVGDMDMAQSLIGAHHALVNARAADDGETPLHGAATYRDARKAPPFMAGDG